jgi:ABC-type nitrate/sulfonate/bicarbonate transport system substrate-binding protein
MQKLFLALATAASLACGQARAADEATISLATVGFGFSTNFIAEDLGYWRDAGLKVKIVFIAGVGSTNAVISRSVDFTNSPLTSIIRANIRGQKIFAIGTAVDGIGQELVVSTAAMKEAGISPDAPIETRGKVLKGKTIAVDGPNTIAHALLRYVARKSGVDPEREITLANMAPGAANAALKRGDIHGYVSALPMSALPVHGGYGTLIASGPRGDFPELMPHAGNMIVTQPDFCDNKPSVCEKIMAGYAKAAALIREKPEEAIAVLKRRFPDMDDKLFETSFSFTRKWTPASLRIDEAVFANGQKFMIAGGMIKAEEAMSDFKAIYTNKYAK